MDPDRTTSPVRRTSPRLAARARQGVSPQYGTPPRIRRRREPELPDLDRIPMPDAVYLDNDNPCGHRLFLFINLPEPVTYGPSNTTVHRLTFPPIVAQPRCLDLNGTLSLPENTPQYVPFSLTSVIRDEVDNRAIYEVRVGRRPPVTIASEIPSGYQVAFREYNAIGLKVSRMITVYLFNAHATWRSLNHLRTVYFVVSILCRNEIPGMLLRFKSLEDELVSLVTNTLTAWSEFAVCIRIIQEFSLFFRSYSRDRISPSRHRRIMQFIEFDFEIYKSSMQEAKNSIRAAAVRNRNHNRIRDEVLSLLETRLLPLQM